jgi:hypothetical protein
MAFIENAIYNYILSQPGITSYVGQDIYHCARPDKLETDFITYEMVTPSNEPYAFGNTNTAQPWFQFSIFSKSDARCIAIGNLVVDALNRFSGALGTGGNVVINGPARGPQVNRDRSDETWFMGIVEWEPEYER